mmetsp:Transcript_36858/g.54144  ORF Transcript_36858/g.54144 Transcript_36858/m.54144 type:complete len:440 (+) Transcript_36858:199-1518(+)|eukprot:CAMPEP_0195527974 /NCGR_PEP_ID=MMETSP0794_2-20130614/29928_1 /TAXON_ID=515487 /ORGANISM="Stephanopyxis turris, Strain CCMP 815" /LENGTH=439 /DNA_ID=CAMNT_0040659003 /DNA_START=197 /DNA_END=1516 /DNA_ORIENTATION=+
MTSGGSTTDEEQAAQSANNASSSRSSSADATAMMGKRSANSTVSLSDWGFPGYLTPSEFAVFEEFRETLLSKDDSDPAFRSAVFSFGEGEDEPYALCRWLRARKFVLSDVLSMIEEAKTIRETPAKDDFYPDPQKALGVEPSIYIAQYPQLYSGSSRSGAPLFISKPGVLNVPGMECITTIAGMLRYHWFSYMHDFGQRLRAERAKHPDFQRFECVCIIDLQGLTSAQVSKRALNIVQVQTVQDSLCFPETLKRMVVINAPSFFSMTWKVMRGWVDARSASKVEIISKKEEWLPRLLELADPSELPSDYGGTAESTVDTLERENHEDGVLRQFTELICVTNKETVEIGLNEKECMDVSVFTRSKIAGTFSISSSASNGEICCVEVKHDGDGSGEEDPTRVNLPTQLCGPAKFTVNVKCATGRFSWQYFLLVGKITEAKE